MLIGDLVKWKCNIEYSSQQETFKFRYILNYLKNTLDVSVSHSLEIIYPSLTFENEIIDILRGIAS